MDIDYIVEFAALAKIGKFQETADMLFISQSTLSKHIKALEKEFGRPLFDRNTKKSTLTEFGQAFFPIAMQFSELQNNCKNLLNEFSTYDKVFNIGVTPDALIFESVIHPLIHCAQDTGAKAAFIENTVSKLKEMLWMKDCELVLLYQEPGYVEVDFNQITLFVDHLACIVPNNHSFAKLDKISAEMLKNEPLVLLREAECSFFRDTALNYCRKAEFEPKISLQVTRRNSLFDSIHAGIGVALWSSRQAEIQIKKSPGYFTIVELDTPVEFSYNVLYRKYSMLDPPIASCISGLVTTLAKISPDAKDIASPSG